MWRKNHIPQRWCGLGCVWKKKMKERRGRNNADPAAVHSEVHPSELKITYILFPLFLENCRGHRVAEWPAVPWNAWSHCNQCSTVWGSQNETLWTLIQRCESMKLAQWPATPALPIFLHCLLLPCLPFLLSVSCFWQSFKCLLKELWQPGRENWNMFLGSLFLDMKKPRKKQLHSKPLKK